MKYLLILLSLFFILACSPDALSPQLEGDAPLVALSEANQKNIQLQALHIDNSVEGNIAHTTYELVFYNPNDRVLEGSLNFPLLDGQNVVGHALEINGKYRQSVVIKKSKAKKIFEDVIRERIDPSIVEKSVGNNFKLRLYPLPAKGVKKVKITIEEILSSHDGKYQYSLPLLTQSTINEFNLTITSDNSQQPKIDFFEKSSVFKSFNKGYRLDFNKKDVRSKQAIKLEIPKNNGTTAYSQSKKDTLFVMKLIKKKNLKALAKASTKKAVIEIIWDSSLTASHADIVKKYALLEAFFSEQKNCRVSLKTLGLKMQNQGDFTVTNGDWTRLKNKLHSLTYNGAKDLSKLSCSSQADKTLFFSNGLNTYSDTLPKIENATLFTLNANEKASPNVLKYLAKQGGGAYINLFQTTSQEAVKLLNHPSKTKVIHQSANIKELYLEDKGEDFMALVRMSGEDGDATVLFNGIEYRLDFAKAKESAYIERLWASEKIEELSVLKKQNKKKIIEMGKQYQIVTDYTSMIVLDRLEDYIKYEVTPPAEFKEAYDKAMERKELSKEVDKKRIIDEVAKLFLTELTWYNKTFPKEKPKPKPRKEERSEGGDVFLSEEVVVPVEPIPEPVVMPSPVPRRASPSVDKKRAKKKKKKVIQVEPTITLKEWNPKAPYIKEIKEVEASKQIEAYHRLQAKHETEASFYVDMADFFYKQGKAEFAVEVLSNLLELDFESSELLRVFAFKLLEYKRPSESLFFFQKIKDLRNFEAQSSRDLALAYEQAKQYQKALDLHYYILTKRWARRFIGSKIVTVNEMNHLIAQHNLDTQAIDRRLIAYMPVDLRIVINWSTDNSDMDLWVMDPLGDKTYYGHKESFIGGKISNDMTQGYGPEEFMIKEAVKGKYGIKVKYYASHQQKLAGPTVIRAEVYTNYGKSNEQRQEIVFRVEDEKEVIDVGEVAYK